MAERTLAKNTTYFTAALTVQKILSFVYFWFISNNLFPGQLGQYVFALSFTTLFSIFVDLGLSPILTREASKKDSESNHLLGNVLGMKIPLGIVTLLITWLIITLTNKPPEVKMLVYLASFVMLLDSFSLSFWVIFRAKNKLIFESVATVLVQIIIFSVGLYALFHTGNVRDLILALLIAGIFNFCYSLSLLKIKLKFKLKPRWDSKTVLKLLHIMPAFALAGVFIKIYNTSDTVLLSFLAGDEAVGFFAIPAKVVSALQQIIPAAFAAVIFPAFSYYYAHSKQQLEQTFVKAFRYIAITSIPMAAALGILAKPIVSQIWPSYTPVIQTFIIMTAAIPFIFLAFPTGYLLNACDRQRNNTLNRGIITVIAIALNILLIPFYGYYGAGITYLITNAVLLLLDFIWVRKIITIPWKKLFEVLGKSALATTVMIAAVRGLMDYSNLLIVVPVGILVYFVVLWLLKGFRFKEFKFSS